MSKNILSLKNLMENLSQEKLFELLKSFESIEKNDIENFLRNKSIQFEKSSIASTHFVFDENKKILGYFTIANRSLVLSKENMDTLSKTQQKN